MKQVKGLALTFFRKYINASTLTFRPFLIHFFVFSKLIWAGHSLRVFSWTEDEEQSEIR